MNCRVLILLFSIFCCSCNYRFFVRKERIYNTRDGYLIFLNRQKIFFPVRKISGNSFFESPPHQTGYLIEFDKEEDALYNAGEKYIVDYSYEESTKAILIRDSIRIIPVSIGSLPYKSKSRMGVGTLIVKYEDQITRLKFLNTNNEAVWSIYPILKEDIQEASDYYN